MIVFIEINQNGIKMLININRIISVNEHVEEGGCSIMTSDNGWYPVNESYDVVKEKIRTAYKQLMPLHSINMTPEEKTEDYTIT